MKTLDHALTPASSPALYIQQMGRAERMVPLRQLQAANKAFWQMTMVAGFLAVFLVAGAVGAHREREACRTPVFLGTDFPGGPAFLMAKPIPPQAQTIDCTRAVDLPTPKCWQGTQTAAMLPWWHAKKVYKV